MYADTLRDSYVQINESHYREFNQSIQALQNTQDTDQDDDGILRN